MSAQAYLGEIVSYGGEWMPRARMIEHLERAAASWYPDDPDRQRDLVDSYLYGFDRRPAEGVSA